MENVQVATADKRTSGKPETRFAFGKNWQRFLGCLTEERIVEAEKSLQSMLGCESLHSESFLDIGSGSGLFSLAAMRLGAARVHSFDYDPQSVACAVELKRRYFPDAANWVIQQGSVLDQTYLGGLGQFDLVYSWGVIHHTGNMWKGLENAADAVFPNGRLFIALYNDQGRRSRLWRFIKRRYSAEPLSRSVILLVFGAYYTIGCFVKDVLLGRNPIARYRQYKTSRGMSYYTDMLDWLGGYPFEVATPDAVFDFFYRRGFVLLKLKTVGGSVGNNEFVFLKTEHP